MLEGAVRWLNYTLETELLMNEIEDSTTRISTLVGAAKQYSQMDRAPFQVLDVHELLDSTLIMLSRKIGDGITVVKDYDRSLPHVPVYGAELNQVWTNLIDNALQAMDGDGHADPAHQPAATTTVLGRDRRHRPGHPGRRSVPASSSRSSPPSRWARAPGLGLDISWRIVVNKHHGDLSVKSEPGDTVFTSGCRCASQRGRPTSDSTRPGRRRRRCLPERHRCVECDAAGGWWVHLRRCAQCGHIGCCDSSPAQHASGHAAGPGHRLVQSFEPGEDWFWDYQTENYYDGPPWRRRSTTRSSSPRRDPEDRLPADWRRHLH